MDPNATLREFHEAIAAADVDTAQERFDAMWDWLAGGGFLPTGYSQPGALTFAMGQALRTLAWDRRR